MRVINEAAFATRPEAVLFDLDNTLYEYERPHADGMGAARDKAKRALNVAARDFDAAFKVARSATKARLGATAGSHSRLLYFAATVETLGFGAQPLLALDLEQTYWRTFLRGAALAPGAEDLLIELRAFGIKLGLVTDLTAQIQFRKLVYFGLDRYFDAIVTSEEAGIEKVGLTPFTLTAAKLKLEQGAPVWMIGDSNSDIEDSKKSLAASTIHKLWGAGDVGRHPKADAILHDFDPILRWVRSRWV